MKLKTLSESFPDICKDWDNEKNQELNPGQFSPSSKKRVWWKCEHGHSYQVSISTRVRTSGCKVCNKQLNLDQAYANRLKRTQSFAEKFPHLLIEWNYEKNAPLTPDKVTYASKKKLWWKCKEGHQWQTTLSARNRGDGCRICSDKRSGEQRRLNAVAKAGKSFAEAHPDLLKEWDQDKNNRSPYEISPKSNYRAAWKCKFGHEWQTQVTNRTNNHSNCPECNPQTSRIEIYLLCEVRTIYPDTKWRQLIGGVECDLYIPKIKLGIEVDGGYWHAKKLQKDIDKTRYFTDKGINLIRVRDNTLPTIDGNQIDFIRTGSLQGVANRLMNYLVQFDTAFANYPNEQQAKSDFKEMMARLPAPPEGETLVNTHPDIAAQWDYDKNAPLVPGLFSKGSNQKFWWLCEKSHSYDAAIKNRAYQNSGCPVCYESIKSELVRKGRLKNTQSLAQAKPVYLVMYDMNKNPLPPSEVAIKSGIDIWWICRHGHSFRKNAANMANNHDCPTCNTLVFKFPDIATQWHSIKNQSVDINNIHAGSGQKVWWKCKNGHEWETAVYMRTGEGTDCPHCYNENRGEIYRQKAAERNGSLADLNPAYLAQWNKEKNGDLSPDKVTTKSRTKAWWECEHGHPSYEQAIAAKAGGSICPECARTKRAESVRLARLKRAGSLKDRYPDIAEHWDNEKNCNFKPELVTAGSKQSFYWKCKQGHEWNTSVNTMTDKRRSYICPVCKNKKITSNP